MKSDKKVVIVTHGHLADGLVLSLIHISVITILPESFFMHCFMMIIVIVIMISVLCYVL